jgi:hypothetical protein
MIWNKGNHPQQIFMTDDEFNTMSLGIREIAIEDLIFIVETFTFKNQRRKLQYQG